MAKVIGNILTSNLSGTIGNLNFYNREGTPVVRRARTKGKPKFTAEQVTLQNRFERASSFATEAVADPDLKFYYKSLATGAQNARNMALKDAMSAPQISEIDFESYNGHPGEKITIRARNFFRVYQVYVKIFNEDGTLIEEGYATEDRIPAVWIYQATKELDTRQAKVEITAENIPGNETSVAKLIKVR
ncbi:hypothetical protein [Chitinophaga sp. CF418]|uniref:hypothetical protein n=1 Tax=Chitinophaga sp. CF418 TaxID=1855287 RepID=UPI000919E3DA|nr:hypothetical protein [Chitinophaga sp. CF418]SHN11034.1 hypothetical protein SAMN05216311_105216 [Chitinophaga sp. CF418]